jgi:hypothetical protein
LATIRTVDCQPQGQQDAEMPALSKEVLGGEDPFAEAQLVFPQKSISCFEIALINGIYTEKITGISS